MVNHGANIAAHSRSGRVPPVPCRLICLALAFVMGCSHAPRFFAVPDFTVRPGTRIAVLPYANLTQAERAPRVIHESVTLELLSVNAIETVEPGLVREAMRRTRVWADDLLSRMQMEALGSELEAEYLLLGSIHEYRTIPRDGAEVPVVSIHARLVEVASGRIIWGAEHSLNGDDLEKLFGLGRIESIDRLAKIVVHESMSDLTRLLGETNPAAAGDEESE